MPVTKIVLMDLLKEIFRNLYTQERTRRLFSLFGNDTASYSDCEKMWIDCIMAELVIYDAGDTFKKTDDSDTPLTGDEVIYGDFLLFNYIGHSGEGFIVAFGTIEELEEAMVSNSAYFNIFCTDMVAIIKGKAKSFELYYDNVHDGTTRLFVKGVDDKLGREMDDMINRRVRWVNEKQTKLPIKEGKITE